MNLSIICRTCTKKFVLSNNLFPIYSNCSLIDDEPPIKIIEIFFNGNFQINQNDKMPQQICSICLQQFISLREFLEQCEMSEKHLRRKFDKINLIEFTDIEEPKEVVEQKVEVDDEEFDSVEYLEDERMDSPEIEQNMKQEIIIPDSHHEIVENISENSNIHIETTEIPEHSYKETFLIEKQPSILNVIHKEDEEPEAFNNEQSIMVEENLDETIDASNDSIYRLEDSDNSSHNEKNDKDSTDTTNEFNFMSRKYNGKFKFKCPDCVEKFFATQRALENHFRKFHLNIDWLLDQSSNSENNLTDKYECDICKQKFKLIISLEKHRLQRHINGRTKDNFVHKCLECGRVYPRSDHLQLHIRNKHLCLNPHVCEICGKSFPVKNQKNSHVKLKHSGIDTSAKCHLCSKKFSSMRYLKRHQAEVHSDKPEFKCIICKKAFFKKTDLTFHSIFHNEKEIIDSKNNNNSKLVKQKYKDDMESGIQENIEVVVGNFIEVESDAVQIN